MQLVRTWVSDPGAPFLPMLEWNGIWTKCLPGNKTSLPPISDCIQVHQVPTKVGQQLQPPPCAFTRRMTSTHLPLSHLPLSHPAQNGLRHATDSMWPKLDDGFPIIINISKDIRQRNLREESSSLTNMLGNITISSHIPPPSLVTS